MAGAGDSVVRSIGKELGSSVKEVVLIDWRWDPAEFWFIVWSWDPAEFWFIGWSWVQVVRHSLNRNPMICVLAAWV